MSTPTEQTPYLDPQMINPQGWYGGYRAVSEDPMERERVRREVQGLPGFQFDYAGQRLFNLNAAPAQDWTRRFQNSGYNPAAAASLSSRLATQDRLSRLNQADTMLRSIYALQGAFEQKRQEIPNMSTSQAALQGYFEAM